MGILTRLDTLLSSNLGDLSSRSEDPGARVEQMIREMEHHLHGARGELKECVVLEKKLETELQKLSRKSAEWKDRALRSVKLGDDDLARQCLARKYDVDRQTAELNEQLTRQRAYIDKLSSAAKALENRVKSLKMRENTLKTQARGGVSGRMNDAFSEFNRFEDRIEGQAAEVELDRTLDPGGRALEEETLRARLENLERSNAADTELAQLKQRAKREATQAPRPGAAQTPIGERPTNTDDELEKEMELIRQQLSTESAGLEDSLKELKQKLDDHDSES